MGVFLNHFASFQSLPGNFVGFCHFFLLTKPVKAALVSISFSPIHVGRSEQDLFALLLSQAAHAKAATLLSKQTVNVGINITCQENLEVVLVAQHTLNSIAENPFSNRNGKKNKVNISEPYPEFSEESRLAAPGHFVSFSMFFIQIKISELSVFLVNLKGLSQMPLMYINLIS